jgi:ribosomal protein S20
MLKSKFYGFAAACMIGCIAISPVSVLASETNSESVTLSENDKDQKDKKSAFDDALKKANDKWDALTDKQKAEVFALLEDEMKAEFKLMDKLVDFGVIDKADANAIKTRMQKKLDELKKSGGFPLSRPKRERKQK